MGMKKVLKKVLTTKIRSGNIVLVAAEGGREAPKGGGKKRFSLTGEKF